MIDPPTYAVPEIPMYTVPVSMIDHAKALAAKDAEIAELKSKLASLPADWNTDSSLETWFPYSAEEIERLRSDVAKLRARVAELERAQQWRPLVQEVNSAVAELMHGSDPRENLHSRVNKAAAACERFLEATRSQQEPPKS